MTESAKKPETNNQEFYSKPLEVLNERLRSVDQLVWRRWQKKKKKE